jgi:hypothetical protein
MALQLFGSKLQAISQYLNKVNGQIVASSSDEVSCDVEAYAADGFTVR